MHGWGEELIIESYKLPWLIWIQLVILFLLILLLSYFGLFAIDFSSDPSSSSSAASLSPVILSFCDEQEEGARNCSEVGRNQEAEGENNTVVRRLDEVATEGGGSAAATSVKDLRHLYHPCHYFEIAKQAFLQCLGLGSRANTTTTRRQPSDSVEPQRRNEE